MSCGLKRLDIDLTKSIKFLMLVLFLVGGCSTAAEAGVMIECTIAEVNATVAELPMPGEPSDTEVLRATHNAIAPVEPSENLSQITFALSNHRMAGTEMVCWITACRRLKLPSPIPLRLLKVPIQVAQSSKKVCSYRFEI